MRRSLLRNWRASRRLLLGGHVSPGSAGRSRARDHAVACRAAARRCREPTLFLGADAWDNPTLLDNDEAAIDGSFFSSHFSPDTNEPSARAFVDTYQGLYGTVPTGGDAVSYDAVRLLLEAAERAGSLDADAVRQELLATEGYAGATHIATTTNSAIRQKARSLWPSRTA